MKGNFIFFCPSGECCAREPLCPPKKYCPYLKWEHCSPGEEKNLCNLINQCVRDFTSLYLHSHQIQNFVHVLEEVLDTPTLGTNCDVRMKFQWTAAPDTIIVRDGMIKFPWMWKRENLMYWRGNLMLKLKARPLGACIRKGRQIDKRWLWQSEFERQNLL